MLSMACSICFTCSAVEAFNVSCTTDCSAQRLRPKARCKPTSARRRVLISTSPWAPARMLIKASESLSLGRSLIVFCAICTCCAIGSKSFSSANLMPTAARLALPVNVFVAHMVDSFMMMMLLSLRFHFSIGMPHHPAFGKLLSCGSLPLIGAKFRYLRGGENLLIFICRKIPLRVQGNYEEGDSISQRKLLWRACHPSIRKDFSCVWLLPLQDHPIEPCGVLVRF